jgi:large subunit ribosomal protein L15e
MGMYKYVREAWKKPGESITDLMHQRLISWRAEPATVKLDHPTRIDRARSLGYRAKEGIFVIRQRVPRGGHRKPFPKGGRRSAKWTTRKTLMLNYRGIAEQRAAKQYSNCEVLNSYEVGKDGKNVWYEVIMIDISHPAIKSDPALSWITTGKHHGRAFRGLTSAQKKSRGLRGKGFGFEKMRPSKTADLNRRRDF